MTSYPKLNALNLPTPRPTKASVVALPTPHSDDATLVAGLVELRPSAVAELFDRFDPLIRGILARTLGNHRDIDDLAQDTFLTIIRRCSTLRDPANLRSFMVSVAIRTARNELRKRSLRHWIGLGELTHPPSVAEHDFAAAQGVRQVYVALDQLDPSSRLAFVLRHIEGCELLEGATVSGCSLATFKRRLAKAEKRFEALSRRDPVLRSWIGHDASDGGES